MDSKTGNVWRLSTLAAAPGNWRTGVWRYGLALLVTVIALCARMALDPILHNNYVFPTFFLAVILVNWLCGLGPTLVTIFLGLMLSDWYLIPPRHRFFAYQSDQWIGIANYLVVSLALTWYGSVNRRARERLAAEVRQRQQTEEALRRAKDALALSNARLEHTVQERTASLQETVGELHHFSYALAHDLRAPLRATDGYLTLIERQSGTALTPGTRELFRRVRQAAGHLDHMITDALNYNKALLRELPLEPVDLQSLLASLLETYPNLQPDTADIELQPGLPRVLGNRAALVQCFANLLDNAVKFSKRGLKPRVRVWAETCPAGLRPAAAPELARGGAESQPKEAEAHADTRPRPCVRVWVEDNGVGIPKESQSRLFGMFQRLTPGYEGTGIGLAIVRKVVERIGGRVGVESEEGQGSRFWVELQCV